MKSKNYLVFSSEMVLYPLLFLFIIVLVFWVESRFHLNFNYLGIYPRKLEGLKGILLSPFIHSNINHLYNNSIPLLVLSTALFYFYKNIRWKILIYGVFFTGLLTWLIGRPSFHIGASGVIYMLTSFLLFKGIFSRQYQLIALSFVVIFLYGSFIWYVFPTDPNISWEAHLAGFVVGFVFSLLFKQPHFSTKKYEWEKEEYIPEKDPFMKQFDEQGNFIELPKEDIVEDEKTQQQGISISYLFKEDIPKEEE